MGRTGFSWLRMGPVAGSCEPSNKSSGSIEKAGCRLTDYQVFKEYPASWSE
jgi:hypothetical protein